jgi:DNA invertase Pin-like site-specific DNA recombinase
MNQKVKASHQKRQAYCYVRQSTLKQVFENTESTKRQYALRERAMALGWPVVQIVTIDSDLGETAASLADRDGFQKLMTEVSLGRVGLVMGLEVSRFTASEQKVIINLAKMAPVQHPQGKDFLKSINLTAPGARKIMM